MRIINKEVVQMKVIVTERIAEEGIQYLRDKGFEADVKLGLSHGELLDIIGEYDAIIVRSVTKVNAELIEKGKNLKVAGRAGNGIDNIDVSACTSKGIIVVNTPESNIMAAAELAVGHAFCLFRNIPMQTLQKARRYQEKRFTARAGRQDVGIIGWRIGR
jgi:D-3-phosphoglycerate dehydrogenase